MGIFQRIFSKSGILLLTVLTGFCNANFAQKHPKISEDSLLNLIEISPERLKSRIYLQLSEIVLDRDTALSKKYALEALNLSVNNDVIRDRIESLQMLGHIYYYQDSMELSLNYLNHALKNAESLKKGKINEYNLKETIGYAHYYRAMNNIKTGSDSTKQIINGLNEALFALEKSEDFIVLASIYHELGKQYLDVDALQKGINNMQFALNLYSNMNQHKKVAEIYGKLSYSVGRGKDVEYFQQALKHYALSGDSVQMAWFIINMAYAANEVLGVEKSMEYFKNALKIFERYKNVEGIVYACFHIGNFYCQNLRDYNMGRYYYKHGIEAGKNKAPTNWYGHLLVSIANLYKNCNKTDSAKMYFAFADSVTKLNSHTSSRIRYLYKYGQFLMVTGKLDSSEKTLNEALRLAKRQNQDYLAKNTYSYMHHLYIKMGNYKKALEKYKEKIALNDSFFTANNQKLITQMQIKYETDQKEYELQLMQKNDEIKTAELKRKQVFLVSLGIGLTLVVLLSIIIARLYLKKRVAYDKLMEKNLESVKTARSSSEISSKKNQSNGLDDEVKSQILKKLKYYINKKKYFLRNDLTLSALAKKCDTNTSYLSKFIHDEYNTNFTGFINELRIREAQRLMAQKEYQNYSIEGISSIVGFKSKSVFNVAFKKYTGVTPSYYLNYVKEH